MRVRTFFDYLEANGKNPIQEWLHELPAQAKSDINATIRMLERERFPSVRDLKPLRGGCSGLHELRVKSGRVQYRPLCCQGPGAHEVTLLAGATEENWEFKPKDACRVALRRKAIVLNDRRRICEHRED